MDKQIATYSEAMRELELEILLHINQQLFQSGSITEELCEKAKEMILKL